MVGERFYNQMMSAEWFNPEKWPEITFRGARIERKDDTHYSVTGDLTIRDVTREVTLAVEYIGQDAHPFSKRTIAVFHAETEIDRNDFGLSWNAMLDSGLKYLGEQVTISLDVEAMKSEG